MTRYAAFCIGGLSLAFGVLAGNTPSTSLPMLEVKGARLVKADGTVARLRGVDIPSLEWSQGDHLFQSLNVAIDGWHANIVRLPLSQDRWFGRSWDSDDDGAHYRQTVRDFVEKAAAKQCYVILDLHWSDAGRWGKFIGQHDMPDTNSVAFWNELAPAFANQPAVLYDLYNEPHDVSWDTWRNGGHVVEKTTNAPNGKFEYETPGLQKLLNLCRDQGAKNVVIAGGLDWAYDLSNIPNGYALADPNGHGVIYDVHLYPFKKEWDKHVTPTAEKYAVMVGEIGNGPEGWLPKAMDYIHRHELPWVAWCLHRDAKPNLIKDWNYTPTKFGETIKADLQQSP